MDNIGNYSDKWGHIMRILTVLCCTGKYKARGFKSTDQACEVCIKTEGLYFPVQRQNRLV